MMQLRRHFALLLLAVIPPATILLAAVEPAGPGTKFDILTVGSVIYRQVQVRSVNARTVIISHAGGLSSLRLHDLSPELQARFHYDPAAEAAAEQSARAPAPAPKPKRPAPGKQPATAMEQLLGKLGTPAQVQAEVDLRPAFFELDLYVKNQGRRPSCAIFAVVSALEFQNAQLTHRAEKFSEEYLIWAVRKTLQRPVTPAAANAAAGEEDPDEGFSLTEVVTALRAYGIPLQASMPNTLGRKIEDIAEPPEEIVSEARNRRRVFVHLLPGRDPASRVNNLLHALNSGLPVAIGLAWPNHRTIRTGFLSGQTPLKDSGHAVTVVGYTCASGRLEDATFIFKNSWGINWGQGGYGVVTYGYLSQHLHDAVLLEVEADRP